MAIRRGEVVGIEKLKNEAEIWLSYQLMNAQFDDAQAHFPNPHRIECVQFNPDNLRDLLCVHQSIEKISDEEISNLITQLVKEESVKISIDDGHISFLYHD